MLNVKIKTLLYLALFSLAAIMLSCSSLQLRPFASSPVIRVGIVLDADEISFEPNQGMLITTKEKGQRYRSEQTDLWTVRVASGSGRPAAFRLLLDEFDDEKPAKEAVAQYKDDGVETELLVVGDVLRIDGKTVAGSARYQVVAQQLFDTRDDAQLTKATNENLADASVISMGEDVAGEIILISPKGDELAVQDAVRLSGPQFTIHNIRVGEGFHWAQEETRTYRGELEFRLSPGGKLSAINVLPLEEYLMGVVPGEMSPSFPLEALKAQAIAARTFFLYNFGRVHHNDPFDVCADVHCQSYVGTKNQNDKVERAVRETRGLVLQHNGELCTTPFSAMCGGHTEHSDNVWSGDPLPYLKGVYDVKHPEAVEAKFSLTEEDNIRKWIESTPDVFCNIDKGGDPSYAQYAKKFFRWQERFTRQELEANIRQYTGRTFGSLVDLQPVSRGVSGRLIELRVVGTTDSFTLGKELRIRKALSPKTLYSACFVIDTAGNGDLPDDFILTGAGWGHGVGMCQIGAALLAERGKNAGDILRHYYVGTKIKSLY